MRGTTPLAMLLLAGCVSHQLPPDPSARIATSVGAMEGDSIANALISRALTADAAMQNPDSVYVKDAEVIANGEVREKAPRLAGVSAGGTLLLGSSKTSVTSSMVWGSIEYRWIPGSARELATSGYATIIVAHLRDGGWRVVHLHSSTIPSPDMIKPARPDTSRHAGS